MVVDWEPEYNRGSVRIFARSPGGPLQSFRSISSEVGSAPREISKLPRRLDTGAGTDGGENPGAGPDVVAEEWDGSSLE